MTHAEALVYAAAFAVNFDRWEAYRAVIKLRTGELLPEFGRGVEWWLPSDAMLAEFKAFGEERRK